MTSLFHNKKIYNLIFLSILFFTFAKYANADTQPADNKPWIINLDVGSMHLNADNAALKGLGEKATHFRLGLNYLKSGWISSFSIGILSYEDNQQFSQLVVKDLTFRNNAIDNRKLEMASSGVDGYSASVSTGKYWQPNESNILSAQAGYTFISDATRSIDNCYNCHSEDISLNGGAFISLGYIYNFKYVSVGLQGMQYFGSEFLKNNISISIGTRF